MVSRWHRIWKRDTSPESTRDDDWNRQSEEIGRCGVGGLWPGEKEARRSALVGREALVAEVSAILFESDPIGINFTENTDEYDSEAETILLRLGDAQGPEDVQRIAHEEFVRWFDEKIAGPPARYAEVAGAIWAAANRKALP